MKHLFHILVSLVVTLVPAAAAQSSNDNDFIAHMMKRIEANANTYPASDYRQITVGPSMMRDVVEMLASTDKTASAEASEYKQTVSELLRRIMSLRILLVSNNSSAYRSLANKVLRDNKRIYKKYDPDVADKDQSQAGVWTRRAGNKVVEIIALLDTGGNAGLRILNLTGDFDNDFMALLSKLSDKQ